MMTECSHHLDLSNDNMLYACAPMYVYNTTKMAVHPSHVYNRTSQKKQNDNKTVNVVTYDIARRIEHVIVYSKGMRTTLLPE